MSESTQANGLSRPQTPAVNSLSLTEYAANPTPPSSTPKEKTVKAGVPDDFLLPSGYPDVNDSSFPVPHTYLI